MIGIPRYNMIASVRRDATFQAYNPTHPSQEVAVNLLKRLVTGLVNKESSIVSSPRPFERGRMVFLQGPPGLGKTHLLEAVVNALREQAPRLHEATVLVPGKLFAVTVRSFEEEIYAPAKIILLDDLFQTHSSIDDVSGHEIGLVSNWVMSLYEHGQLAILSSNHSLDALMTRVEMNDKVGRVKSRLHEMMAGVGRLVLEGDDYRVKLAESSTVDPFDV